MNTPTLTRRERRQLERVAVKARRGQPYIESLLAAGATLPRGSVSIVEVLHDDWCPKMRGGLCRCQPDIVILEVAA